MTTFKETVILYMKNTKSPSSLLHPSLALVLGYALLCSPNAFADATVVYEQVAGSNKSINAMKIKDGKIRFTPPNQGNNSFSLYDSSTGSLTHADTSQKKFLTMDENDIAEQAKKVKQQMEKMREQMLAKIKTMPPEQQQQAQQMMNQHLPQLNSDSPQPKVEQKKTSRTETIAGIQCTVHESYISGAKANEICMAAPEQLGLSAEDTRALMSMQEFMKRMQKVAQNMMGNNAPVADLEGVPLHTKLFGPDGSIKLETRLASINQDELSSDTVMLPVDYTAVQMPAMP